MAKPRILWDSKGKTREEWLEVRAHGPDGSLDYTLGGSDIPIIFGVSPWCTAAELWHLKRELIVREAPKNKEQLELGHLMEPIIGHLYKVKTGNTEIEDTLMYQHATRDYAIADLDARVLRRNGSKCILEKKFVTYRNASEWADGMVPAMYELQGRWYMAIDDSDDLEYAALWGNNPETDLANPPIRRNEGAEKMIFDVADAFIKSLRSGIAPGMKDFHNPKLALQSLARIVGKSQSGLPTVEFSSKFERHIRKIEEMQARNAELQAEIKKNDAVIDANAVPIAEVMKTHEVGEFVTPKERFVVQFSSRFTKRPDSKKLKEKYPIIFEEVLKTTESRKVKVKKEAV